MRNFKKVLSLILAVLMLTLALTGCSKPTNLSSDATGTADKTTTPVAEIKGKDIYNDALTIAWLPLSMQGPSNAITTAGYTAALRSYPNVTLKVFDCGFDVTRQISMVNDCITQKVDAIIMEAMDDKALNSVITDAEEAGIPVITFSLGATAVHTLHLGGADYNGGLMVGEALANELNKQGNVVALDGPVENVASDFRYDGFEDYIKQNAPNIKIIDYQNVPNFSTDNANQITRDLLTKHSDIDAIYCAADDLAIGAVQACQAAGRTDISIWSNAPGLIPALQLVKEGKLSGTVLADMYTMMATGVYMTLNFIQLGTTSVTAGYTETPTVELSMELVTLDNVDRILRQSHHDDLK